MSNPEIGTITSEHTEIVVAPRTAYALPGSDGRHQATISALIHLTLVCNQ